MLSHALQSRSFAFFGSPTLRSFSRRIPDEPEKCKAAAFFKFVAFFALIVFLQLVKELVRPYSASKLGSKFLNPKLK